MHLIGYREIEAEGHDEESLLFGFLDELLFIFHTELLVCKTIVVTHLDRESWSLRARGCASPCCKRQTSI